MKLEHVPDGSPECPLLRLFDFHASEACELRHIFENLGSGSTGEFDLQTLSTLMPVNGCRLVLAVGESDTGIVLARDGGFICTLTPETWSDVAALVEPFCKPDTDAFQWLTEHSDIALLLSTSGGW